MNTSSRVPGLTRNSGWRAVAAEIAAERARQERARTSPGLAKADWDRSNFTPGF
jgi:hypothetical protein